MSAAGSSIGTWIDGVAGTAVPVDDRALQYGDGLFETILVRDGRARFLAAHLSRLARGCARLGIPYEDDALRTDVARALVLSPPLAVLKLLVTRGSAVRRGYAPAETRPRRIVTLWPTSATDDAGGGVSLGIARTRAATSPALAGLKHLNRLDNVLAAAEIADGDFDVLMLDVADRLVSGSSCNLFTVRDGRLATPKLDSAGVAGVVRGIVLREAPKAGVVVQERALTLADLAAADEVFITNARIGVVPVRRVGEHAFRTFELALRLRGHIEALDA
jgi:4-amino-4-deoxychorismate lyase